MRHHAERERLEFNAFAAHDVRSVEAELHSKRLGGKRNASHHRHAAPPGLRHAQRKRIAGDCIPRMVKPDDCAGVLRTAAGVLEDHVRIEPEGKDVAETLSRKRQSLRLHIPCGVLRFFRFGAVERQSAALTSNPYLVAIVGIRIRRKPQRSIGEHIGMQRLSRKRRHLVTINASVLFYDRRIANDRSKRAE